MVKDIPAFIKCPESIPSLHTLEIGVGLFLAVSAVCQSGA